MVSKKLVQGCIFCEHLRKTSEFSLDIGENSWIEHGYMLYINTMTAMFKHPCIEFCFLELWTYKIIVASNGSVIQPGVHFHDLARNICMSTKYVHRSCILVCLYIRTLWIELVINNSSSMESTNLDCASVWEIRDTALGVSWYFKHLLSVAA